ncbi:MAG: hypothetical protein K6C98_05560 [Treponema sp.]|nr:hypothetical protein [Treponema sp.]
MKIKMFSLAMILSLALSVMSCSNSNSPDDTEAEQSVFALVNIPFDKFFEAETDQFDAYSSATQKAANGSITYGTYHVSKSDSSELSEQVTRGITYPVKVNVSDLENLKNLGGKEITDSTPAIDVTTTGRGGTNTIRYSGKQTLYHNGDYSYFILSEAPTSYKKANFTGSNVSFEKIKGNTVKIDTLYVTIEPGEAHHEFSPMLTLYVRDSSTTSTSGIPVTKLTFADISEKAQKITGTEGNETITEQNLNALRTIIATSTDGKSYGLTVLNNMFWGKSQMGFQAPAPALVPEHELVGKEIASLKFVTEKEVYVTEKIISGKVENNVFYPAVSLNTPKGRNKDAFVIPSLKATDDRTERANYKDSIITVKEAADFDAAGLSGTYEELFTVITQSKYDSIWEESIKKELPALSAEDVSTYAAMFKSYCTGNIYGQEAIDAYTASPTDTKFDCYFINGITKFTFDGMYISGTDKNGVKVFEHPYKNGGELTIPTGEGDMTGVLYESLDSNSGEFTYFLMMPDTPATTYHTEFRYGSNKDDLAGFATGQYAYWLAAGITENADETMIKNVIALFCEENTAEMK